jgi:hypothetical protein
VTGHAQVSVQVEAVAAAEGDLSTAYESRRSRSDHLLRGRDNSPWRNSFLASS